MSQNGYGKEFAYDHVICMSIDPMLRHMFIRPSKVHFALHFPTGTQAEVTCEICFSAEKERRNRYTDLCFFRRLETRWGDGGPRVEGWLGEGLHPDLISVVVGFRAFSREKTGDWGMRVDPSV